ncbi:hypothetical protein SAMN05421666_2474 [Roseovarius nanhaiticus]|uniref:Uncharacterized protein n=1 Tax=Roseovarius nanhaiticus TaxID=573024 RepID=A0A1N7H4B2_9RHOB|nr:hypothetical protein [Roseovarius nanhaiticus]SEL13588.1 hypothetical protein SAMN05216208_2845 [Roseovarius nanhaiticus]SIS19685.1 hypothetical protein SAMN05421666_2474 [Roseovarius nanhaiticus]
MSDDKRIGSKIPGPKPGQTAEPKSADTAEQKPEVAAGKSK